jgi:hypothetical protein
MFKVFGLGVAIGALAGWLMGSAKGGAIITAGKDVVRK